MSIVKHTDKRSGVTYVYESESYWDKEKKQPRSKRKYIGKVDPETGEIIPCRKETAPISSEDATEIVRLRTTVAEQEKKISVLETELQKAKVALEEQNSRLKEIAKLAKAKE